MRLPFKASIPDSAALTKYAALAASHVAFYPSILYNVARCQLQENWNWYNQVTQHIYLGALPSSTILTELKQLGVRAVVTLNQHYELLVQPEQYVAAGFNHLHLPTVDYLYAPPLEELHKGVSFIAEHVKRGELVYVHCKAGRGRSTVVVLCYLIKEQGMGVEEAWDLVLAKRPQVCLASSQWEAVREFAASCKAADGSVDSSSHISNCSTYGSSTQEDAATLELPALNAQEDAATLEFPALSGSAGGLPALSGTAVELQGVRSVGQQVP